MARPFRRCDGRFVRSSDADIVPQCYTHEDWFVYTDSVAELWCTLTMVPLALAGLWALRVGWWFGGFLTLHAAVASAVSHAVPRRCYLQWDISAASALAVWSISIFQWRFAPWYVMPVIIGALDNASRRAGFSVRGLHALWHCAAAVSLCVILSQHHF